MNISIDETAERTALIYRNCCVEMGRRFHSVARKYEERGDFQTAKKLKEEAVIQFSAVRAMRSNTRRLTIVPAVDPEQPAA